MADLQKQAGAAPLPENIAAMVTSATLIKIAGQPATALVGSIDLFGYLLDYTPPS